MPEVLLRLRRCYLPSLCMLLLPAGSLRLFPSAQLCLLGLVRGLPAPLQLGLLRRLSAHLQLRSRLHQQLSSPQLGRRLLSPRLFLRQQAGQVPPHLLRLVSSL